MKKAFSLFLIISVLLSLSSCEVINEIIGQGGVCQHADADGDKLCDNCGKNYTSTAMCEHRDSDDDSICDKCGNTYIDGDENGGTGTVCQHRDANDDGKCDKCSAAFTDGDENSGTGTVCQHRDANDDGKCDKCSAAFTDGDENSGDVDCAHTSLTSRKENAHDAAGCTDGSYECVIICNSCGDEVARTTVTVPAPHSFSGSECSSCGEKVYRREGDYVYFGEYPGAIKADNVLITDITDDRGYYLGSDGEFYAKITAKPYKNTYSFSNGESITRSETYYFKAEPIRWRILTEDDGRALVMCDSIIYSMAYDGAPGGNADNVFDDSMVRAWLGGEFYNTAFDAQGQSIIPLTEVYNGSDAPGTASTKDTEDRVFLLSVAEVTNGAYGFGSDDAPDDAKKLCVSDFALAVGAYQSGGIGEWWLRTASNDKWYAIAVDSDGNCHSRLDCAESVRTGIVPAMYILL